MKFLAFLFIATLRGKDIPENNLDEGNLRLKLLAYQNATSISWDSTVAQRVAEATDEFQLLLRQLFAH